MDFFVAISFFTETGYENYALILTSLLDYERTNTNSSLLLSWIFFSVCLGGKLTTSTTPNLQPVHSSPNSQHQGQGAKPMVVGAMSWEGASGICLAVESCREQAMSAAWCATLQNLLSENLATLV